VEQLRALHSAALSKNYPKYRRQHLSIQRPPLKRVRKHVLTILASDDAGETDSDVPKLELRKAEGRAAIGRPSNHYAWKRESNRPYVLILDNLLISGLPGNPGMTILRQNDHVRFSQQCSEREAFGGLSVPDKADIQRAVDLLLLLST
jgi:hypothetical protein